MNESKITAGTPDDTAAAAASDPTTQNLRARVTELEVEIEQMRSIAKMTAEFYLSGIFNATTPQEVLESMASMLQSYLGGGDNTGENAKPWVFIAENRFGIATGSAVGDADVEVANSALDAFRIDPTPRVFGASDGRRFIVIPIPRNLDPLELIGVWAIETTKHNEPAASAMTVGLTIALGSAVHVDRVVGIFESSRNEQFARAAARVQRALTRPRELEQAMVIAVKALADCDDVSGAAGVDFEDGEPQLVAIGGEIDERAATELIGSKKGRGLNGDGEFARLPVKIDGETIGMIVLAGNPSLGVSEDEMLDSIAVAVAGSAARHRAASTIESLRRLATRRLVEAQERERSIVAADIHDGVLQQLGATAIRLELAQSRVEQGDFTAAREIIEDGAGEIRSCARELRALLMELRPQVLDDNGLSAALKELGGNVEGVEIDVTADVPDNIGNEYSITIFRIVQEALTNIQKHAHANHGSVRVTLRNGAIEIEIRDDGIGYEAAVTGPSLEGSHLGLLGMRERARMLGGNFSIEGHSGEGTVIKLHLPLDVGYTGYSDTGAWPETPAPG